jgi:DNA adenine methylase
MSDSHFSIAQPFLKWVGGKRSLLAELHSHLPESFNRYYEPFIGGGALFFSLADRITEAVLSDNNLELVLTYQAVKKDPERLINLLKEHEKRHSKEYFYNVRKDEFFDPIEKAARFIYLNKTCYNGLYRVNKAGKFNSPLGSYKNPGIVQEENIWACHQALQKTKIILADFESETITPQKGDFVYFDPPYHPTVEDLSFTAYTKDGFSEKDQVRLRDYIIRLTKKGVHTMLSNSKTTFIESIYTPKYFDRHVVKAPRFVNCKPGERDEVEELLITNY